jgi:hypothetical protein
MKNGYETYFTGGDASVYISGGGLPKMVQLEDCIEIAWNSQEPKLPHFNFDELYFTSVSEGARIIQGQLTIARSVTYPDPLKDLLTTVGSQSRSANYQTSISDASSKAVRLNSVSGSLSYDPLSLSSSENSSIYSLQPGPYRLHVELATRDIRVSGGGGKWVETDYGSIELEMVYFTGESPGFSYRTADALAVPYMFIARNSVRLDWK